MQPIVQYHKAVAEALEKIATAEKANIEKAAQLVSQSIAEKRIVHVFGSGGHSNMAAIEVCHRAGNLAPFNAILDSGIGCEHGATRYFERLVGYAKHVLDYYRVAAGDTILLINAYGMNCVTIDAAMESRKRSTKVIAITSPELSVQISPEHPARHPSKKNLFELADVVINSYTPYGEAVVDIDGFKPKVSPISTITNIFIVDAINAQACQYLADSGITPPVWTSGNVPGGDEANKHYLEMYFGKLRHL
jgi:uncharacterized phosphosugar-binding protein